MSTLIKGGLVIDPRNQICSQLNLLLQDGRVAAITESQPEADQVIDAAGRVVTPGFVDIHMHEDPVGPDGHLVRDDATAIFPCMLRMGVTTVLAGQCGINRADPGDYLDLIDRDGAAVNVAMLAGHAYMREACGHMDKYTPVSEAELTTMEAAFIRALDQGCFGISYGIRYVPGIDRRELERTAAVCRGRDGLIAATSAATPPRSLTPPGNFWTWARHWGFPCRSPTSALWRASARWKPFCVWWTAIG